MVKELQGPRYRAYWWTWGILLVLTLVMILLGRAKAPRLPLVSLLILGMLAKAALIGGYFMHLRFERRALVLAVAGGILLTAAALFVLIAPDGIRILTSSPH